MIINNKNTVPDKSAFEKMLIERYTQKVVNKVKNAHVAVAGLGGLGSNIAIALARTGVGHLHLLDFDIVELSNLNRQQYKINHLGMLKTEALKSELEMINPYINIQIDTVKVTENNILQLFKNDEIICEAFDSPDAKAMLINNLVEKFPHKKIVSASGMAGFESSNTIKTRKITKNLYLCGDYETEVIEGRGLMAPRVAICAGHQANMVLRLILEIEEV